MSRADTIQEVVRSHLCMGCGACAAVCKRDAVLVA